MQRSKKCIELLCWTPIIAICSMYFGSFIYWFYKHSFVTWKMFEPWRCRTSNCSHILDSWHPSGSRTRLQYPLRKYCSVSSEILLFWSYRAPKRCRAVCKAFNTPINRCIAKNSDKPPLFQAKQLELLIQHPCMSVGDFEVVYQFNDFWLQRLGKSAKAAFSFFRKMNQNKWTWFHTT